MLEVSVSDDGLTRMRAYSRLTGKQPAPLAPPAPGPGAGGARGAGKKTIDHYI